MISVKEAQRRILENTFPTPPEILPLREATGRILAESLASPYPLPFFDNSAMDGYAVRAEETPASFKITASIPAGTPAGILRPGEAFRIFTGAMVPEGADAVVKQEEVVREDDRIVIKRAIEAGENIRTQGEEIEKGDTLLQAGARLTPAAIGLLASVGLKEVPVFSKPRVGIIVTGSEIVAGSDGELRPGKIFDSNSFSLAAALEELRLIPSFIHHVPDERDSLQRALRDGFHRSDFLADFLIVTGGVSVGDFDFVREVAREAGVEEVFWKVAQKPGKPMFFGKRDQTFLFGLPGNPASALVCFYEYVRPALLRSMGSRTPFLTTLRAHLKEGFRKKAGMTHFLKGRHFADLSVEILENQGSHMMSSFAAANCMVVIPEEKEEMKKGDEVEIHLLPS